MTVEFKIVATSKGQLSRSSGIIAKGFSKPRQRLIKELLYGIQASKDIKLSNLSSRFFRRHKSRKRTV